MVFKPNIDLHKYRLLISSEETRSETSSCNHRVVFRLLYNFLFCRKWRVRRVISSVWRKNVAQEGEEWQAEVEPFHLSMAVNDSLHDSVGADRIVQTVRDDERCVFRYKRDEKLHFQKFPAWFWLN